MRSLLSTRPRHIQVKKMKKDVAAGGFSLCDKDPAMYLIDCMPKGPTESVNYILSSYFSSHSSFTEVQPPLECDICL